MKTIYLILLLTTGSTWGMNDGQPPALLFSLLNARLPESRRVNPLRQNTINLPNNVNVPQEGGHGAIYIVNNLGPTNQVFTSNHYLTSNDGVLGTKHATNDFPTGEYTPNPNGPGGFLNGQYLVPPYAPLGAAPLNTVVVLPPYNEHGNRNYPSALATQLAPVTYGATLFNNNNNNNVGAGPYGQAEVGDVRQPGYNRRGHPYQPYPTRSTEDGARTPQAYLGDFTMQPALLCFEVPIVNNNNRVDSEDDVIFLKETFVAKPNPSVFLSLLEDENDPQKPQDNQDVVVLASLEASLRVLQATLRAIISNADEIVDSSKSTLNDGSNVIRWAEEFLLALGEVERGGDGDIQPASLFTEVYCQLQRMAYWTSSHRVKKEEVRAKVEIAILEDELSSQSIAVYLAIVIKFLDERNSLNNNIEACFYKNTQDMRGRAAAIRTAFGHFMRKKKHKL